MWVSKNRDERKEEFIRTALELFMKKGYENTSLNDILRVMNITKGSFYHNFSSREELLESCVRMIAEDYSAVASEAAGQSGSNALDMLIRLSSDTMKLRTRQEWLFEIFKAIEYDERNAFLYRRITERIIADTEKHVEKIIAKGVLEKTFFVEEAGMAAELYIRILMLYKQQIAKALREEAGKNATEKKLVILEAMFSRVISGLLGLDASRMDYLKIY